jgi:Protein of unknown function (DUF4236)
VGFRFRRSVRILPGIRINFSTSGASVSLGPRGLHYTVGPKGTRVTASIPGSGLSWTQYTPHASHPPARTRPAARPPAKVQPYTPSADEFYSDPPLIPIQNASAEKINALSTSELAPILKSAHRRIRISLYVMFLCFSSFILAFISHLDNLIGLVAAYTTIFVPLSIFLDRYRRSVKIEYKLDKITKLISSAIDESFTDLSTCNSIWSVQAQAHTTDWKRNAGATLLNKRQRIYLKSKQPSCIRGPAHFPAINLGADELYFLPDATLLVTKDSVAALSYQDFSVLAGVTRFIESEAVPKDANVVGETWRFVNKSGGPDRRFNFNKRLPICLYGEIDFQSAGGLNGKMHFSNLSAADRFLKVLDALRQTEPDAQSKSITHFEEASHWPTIVFCCLFLSFGMPLVSTALSSKAFNPHGFVQTEDRGETIRFAQSPITSPPTEYKNSKQLYPSEKSATLATNQMSSSMPARPSAIPPTARTAIPLPRPRPKR